jgi:hypothetical protein
MIGVCLLNFTPELIFIFKLAILIHNVFGQIDDLKICLWHLNIKHFIESP